MQHKENAFMVQGLRIARKRIAGEKVDRRAAKRYANALIALCRKSKGANGPVTANSRRKTYKAFQKVFAS